MRNRDSVKEVFDFLIQYERLMYKIARQYVDSQLDCEDIVQDSLANILKKYDAFGEMSKNQRIAYVAAVVRNRSLNFLKRKKLEDSIIVASVDDDMYHLAESVVQETKPLTEIPLSVVREAINKLPNDDRYLIEGKYIVGLSDAELAQELKCKPASIRMKLTKARRKLLAEMKKLGEAYER